MASIRIERPTELMNMMRSYVIYINGIESGKVKNSEVRIFNVKPGKHFVTAKIDWCGSQDFEVEVKANETIHLKLKSFKYGNLLLLAFLGALFLNLISIYAFKFNLFEIFFWPVLFLIYYLYYITFGRYKYLSFKKLNKTRKAFII
jgi:hypothetical protein